jgi:hypothetical protein
VAGETFPSPCFDFYHFLFDNDHDGELDIGDDHLVVTMNQSGGSSGVDMFQTRGPMLTEWVDYDYSHDGTNDVIGAATHSNPIPAQRGQVEIEVSQPLDSTDDVHDISLAPGAVAGLAVLVADGGVWDPDARDCVASENFYWPTPSPAGWADFVVAPAADTDADGNPDVVDTDDDNDGVLDGDDAFPSDPSEWIDSDHDGIGNNADPDDDNDGVVDTSDAFPFDPTEWVDTDGDGVGNNADLDDDNDELEDGFDPDPVTRDADGDGILDGEDVEWLQSAIQAVPSSQIKSPAAANRQAMISILNDVEQLIAVGDYTTAIQKLRNLRQRVDGCGSKPDKNDWIINCSTQIQIRSLIDELISNLRT